MLVKEQLCWSVQPVDGPIAIIQVSCPHLRNALSWRAVGALADDVETDSQNDLRTLIITEHRNAFITIGE
jgi:hypothetical protein